MTINAAQYVRMSTDRQPMSTDIQRAAIAIYAQKHGFKIVQTYSDEAKSGLSLKGRTGMSNLLRDVMEPSCPFRTVLVLDVSRWGRYQDADEAAYYEYHCRKHGVQVFYVAEPFAQSETPSPYEAIFKSLKRINAAEYSRELAVKVRAGHLHVTALGFATGSLPCVGYRRLAVAANGTHRKVLESGERKSRFTDRTLWVLGPESEQILVRRIFEDYAAGMYLKHLAKQLNAEGFKTHDELDFTATKLRRLIDNEIVIGIFTWGARHKTYNKGTRLPKLANPPRNDAMVPALIPAELWQRAQARCAYQASLQKGGYSLVEMISRLRAALATNPALRYRDFVAAGLPGGQTYLRRFGTMANAYSQAGRPQTPLQQEHRDRASRAIRLRKRLCADLQSLLVGARVDSVLNLEKNMLLVRGVEVKVCAARMESPSRWRVDGTEFRRAPERWLLVMRLNADKKTGRDFYVLPPTVHATFRGTIGASTVRELERYRVDSADALVVSLSRLRYMPSGSVPHS